MEGILRDTSMDGVEHVRQSRPRPGDRRADPVIEMLAVENTGLTLPSWLQGGRAVIGHNILIRNVTGSSPGGNITGITGRLYLRAKSRSR